MVANQKVVFPLKSAYQDFVELILQFSSEQLLSPISTGEWAPRDVIAHLIGWNSLMIESSQSILAGKPPAYYADEENDYSSINAGFTTRFSSHSKQELLEQLKSSMERLEAFVLSLLTSELTADHGVRHYSGSPATVSKIIESLAGDYQSHTRQIKEWLNNS